MSESRLEWKVGLFVFVCLVLLALLLLNFSKGLTFFQSTYMLRLKSSSVAGIKQQAPVLMAGVQVGNVTGAELSSDGRSVIIFLKIAERYKIHRDAVFAIDSIGVLGDQYVAIRPGKNEAPVLQDGDEVICGEAFNFQDVARSATGFIERVDETAQKLNEALARLDRLLLNEQTLTDLSAAIGNFRRASERAVGTVERIDNFVASNAPPAANLMTNLTLLSRRLNDLTDDLHQVVTMNQGDLASAVKRIESSSVLVNNLLTDLQAGRGLAGSLLKDEDLDQRFSLLVSNMSTLSSNLNRHGLLWKPRKADRTSSTLFQPGRSTPH